MDQDNSTLTRDALELSAKERIELVDALLASLDAPVSEVDQAWANEAERRLDDYIAGKTSSKSSADVLAKHLKP